MTQEHKPGTTDATYRYCSLSLEELAGLPAGELLQACQELRQVLDVLKGILYSPERTLIFRAVSLDLFLSETERLSREAGAGTDAPVMYDTKKVSDRLGIRPPFVQQAYEELNSLGAVEIVARRYPRGKRQQPLPFEENNASKDDG